ncbi:FecR family protein [Chitinophaga varians]|uniref:FecR family protein n=1 Tax=Chitinophaga varians TaxID=2202339 RepID=UPI00165EEE30|nr:FecR family protein [Chitinophaga varians]MBC9909165.1 FecR domain-containing protein [Chitinophaga varians]
MSHPDKSLIDRLLEKHALGICTEEERAVLDRWYASFPAEGRVFEDEAERKATRELMKAGIFEIIGTMPAAMPEKRPVRRLYWQVAAAILLLIVAGDVFFSLRDKPAPASYATVTAPAGKQVMHVQLPDGSVMWLEPGSRLRYADPFGKNSRHVQMLDGRAYFSVAPGASAPFVVSAPGGIETKVLGTEFSVKAYQGVGYIQVGVSTGKVQVSDSTAVLGVLEAGQQIVYQLETHKATREDGDIADWRNGALTMQNASFAEVARILQNHYGVQVSYEPAMMATYRFNLRIAAKTSLEETLEMLKDLSGMTYTLSNGRVTVTGIQQ